MPTITLRQTLLYANSDSAYANYIRLCPMPTITLRQTLPNARIKITPDSALCQLQYNIMSQSPFYMLTSRQTLPNANYNITSDSALCQL
jgi:hypothetical protein